MNKDITALILSGGQGTRIRHLLNGLPKPMYPVFDKPFIEYQINYLQSFGIKKFVISTGYRSDAFKEYFGAQHTIVEESEPLGTGGAVLFALDAIETEKFICLNGDTLFLLNFQEFLDDACARPYSSIALKVIEDSSRYGSVWIDNQTSRITRFSEKNTDSSGLINAGIYLLNKSQLQKHNFERICSIEKDIFPELVKDGLYGFKTEAEFIDIGTPETLNIVEDFILRNGLK